MTRPVAVLMVCTGNIGRSPMAERLLRHHLDLRLGAEAGTFDVSSAGTMGCVGEPMEEFAAVALAERGGSSDGFRARALAPELLASADLVLTATREHRATVASLHPQVVRRTFTLKEFARLAGPVTDAGLMGDSGSSRRELVQARIDLAGRLRGLGEPTDAAADDVVDPLGAPLDTYRERADEIDQACIRALDLLVGPSH